MGKVVIKSADAMTSGYRLGRAAFAKISAVEGIHLTDEMERDFQSFDEKGLSPEERRRLIIDKYGRRRA